MLIHRTRAGRISKIDVRLCQACSAACLPSIDLVTTRLTDHLTDHLVCTTRRSHSRRASVSIIPYVMTLVKSTDTSREVRRKATNIEYILSTYCVTTALHFTYTSHKHENNVISIYLNV